jgi:hypothetical protein
MVSDMLTKRLERKKLARFALIFYNNLDRTWAKDPDNLNPWRDELWYPDLRMSQTNVADESVEAFQIFVTIISGKTVTLDVDSNTTIRSVKKLLSKSEHVPVGQIRMSFGDKPLANHRQLSHYGIHQDPTLKMLLRLKGGDELPAGDVYDDVPDLIAIPSDDDGSDDSGDDDSDDVEEVFLVQEIGDQGSSSAPDTSAAERELRHHFGMLHHIHDDVNHTGTPWDGRPVSPPPSLVPFSWESSRNQSVSNSSYHAERVAFETAQSTQEYFIGLNIVDQAPVFKFGEGIPPSFKFGEEECATPNGAPEELEPVRIPVTRQDRVPLVLRPGVVLCNGEILRTSEEPLTPSPDGVNHDYADYDPDVVSDYEFYYGRSEDNSPRSPVSDEGNELRCDLARFALAQHLRETAAPPMYSPPRPRSKSY